MWSWLERNSSIVALIATVAPVAWAVVQYILTKRAESKRFRFETYHRLVKELVQVEEGGPPMLDHQMAVVFELRGFRHYYPVSLRILHGLKAFWSQTPGGTSGANARLIEEIDLAIKFIKPRAWLSFFA